MKKFENIKIINKKEKVKLSKEEKVKLKEEKTKEKKELKEKKKESKNTLISNREVLPFLDVDEDNFFVTKQGFLNLYQVKTRDVSNLSEYETMLYIYNFIHFLRNYIDDFKIIAMNFPVNTVKQQEYLNKKLEETDNPKYIGFLEEKLNELKFLETHRNNKEFFLMVFMKNEVDKENLLNKLNHMQNVSITLKNINLEKKMKILFKLNNMNTKLM